MKSKTNNPLFAGFFRPNASTAAIVFSIGVAAIQTLVAQSISINFGADQSGSSITESTKTAGAVAIAGNRWNNTTVNGGGTLGSLIDNTGATTTASVTWTSANTWQSGSTGATATSENGDLTKGYLDDSGAGWTATITNNPYLLSNIYVIHATDQGASANMSAVSVNGTFYKGNGAGGTVQAAGVGDSWTAANFSTADTLTESTNYIKVLNQGSVSIAGYSSSPGRAALAGLQIENAYTGNLAYWDINGNTAGTGGATPSGNWGDANWSSDAAGSSPTGSWTPGHAAVFAAGTDAIAPYTVTLTGPQTADALWIQENAAITITGSTLTLSGPGLLRADGSSSLNVTSVLSGTDIRTSGAIILGAANTYTGSTTVGAGSLIVSGGSAIPDTSAVTLGGSLTLGTSETIGTLSGSGGVTLNTSTLALGGSADTTYSGVIDGSGGIVKKDSGILSLPSRSTYTGGTTINGGVLNLTGGGGSAGTIRGTVTANSGGTLRLSTGDATGYGTGTDRVSTINLAGGTLDINTASNQTLGSAVINMTGGSITGVAGSNLDFFAGASALNVIASSSPSQISGTKINLRQANGLTITVADGASATDLTVSSPITSTVAGYANNKLTKAGSGTMEITGNCTYSVPTRIDSGTLKLGSGGSISSTPSITVASGAILDVSAITGYTLGSSQSLEAGDSNAAADILGNVISEGTIRPGGTGTIGTISGTTNLTLGGTLIVDVDRGTNNSDSFAINGILTISPGFAVTVNPTGIASAGVKSYVIASGIGTLVGSSNLPAVLGYEWDATSNPTQLVLKATSANLVWKGSPGDNWDFVTSSWDNGGVVSGFADGDAVTFDDSADGSGPVVVNLIGDVQPISVTINNTRDYTLQQDASAAFAGILGGTSVVKKGSGLVNLLSDNIHTGGTVIQEGILAFDDGTLGTSGAIMMDGGTLRWYGTNTQNISGRLTMVAGKTATFDTNGNDVGFTESIGGGSTASLAKTGSGILTLTSNATYTGGTVINGGVLNLDGGSGSHRIRGVVTVNSGAELRFTNGGDTGYGANAITTLNINGGTVDASNTGSHLYGASLFMTGGTIKAGTSGQWQFGETTVTTLASSSTAKMEGAFRIRNDSWNDILAPLVFNVADGSAAIDLEVAVLNNHTEANRPGAVEKNGEGTMSITGVCDYAGDTTVNGGTLNLAAGSELRFEPTDTSSNKIAGTAAVTLGGAFVIAPTGITVTTGTWTVVDVGTLNETYGGTFVVKAADGTPWTNTSGVWTHIDTSGRWTFTQATGELTLAPGNTFSSWMGGFTFAPGADTTPGGDADGDGVSNLVENVLGTAPNAPTTGISQITGAPGALAFRHPVNTALASDVAYSYVWSTDLTEWKVSGESNTGGTTVTISAVTTGGLATVNATVTPSSPKVFVRIKATQTP